MKKQNGTKRKLMMGISTGMLSATTVAMPLALTSCGKKETNINNLDEVYGVDETTYVNMKTNLVNQYFAYLKWHHDSDIENKMTNLNTSLVHLDESVNKHIQNNASNIYTAATTTLLNVAKKIGIGNVVSRSSKASWGEVDTLFANMKSSFTTYMLNHSFNTVQINEVINNATKSYSDVMNDIKSQYDQNDKLGGVLKAKSWLLSCFDSVNNKIAKLAATIRLNDFITNYSFQYRMDASSYQSGVDSDMNRLDILSSKIEGGLKVGSPIEADVMNRMFVCFNNETRQKVEFKNNLLPGYTLIPKLDKINKDEYSNTCSISIDWTLVSNNAKDKDIATAHLIEVDEESIKEPASIKSLDDVVDQTDSFKIKTIDYSTLSSSQAEASQLQNAYFNQTQNGNKIELTWLDSKAEPCYDGFMFADQKSTAEQTLTMRQLAYTGIAIKYGSESALLKDVIDKVNQEGYEPQNTIEKFVKYCDVYDHIKIETDPNDKKLVRNSFEVRYKNEFAWQDLHYQKTSGSYQMEDQPIANDFKTSEEFFELVNDAYNSSYASAKLYIDKEYEDIADKSLALTITVGLGLAISSTITLTTIALMGFHILAQKWDLVFAYLIASALESFTCGFAIKDLNLISEKFDEPIRDYKARADEFTGGESYDFVNDTLNNDLHYFVLKDSQGRVDEEEFKRKQAIFNNPEIVSHDVQNELFNKYTHFRDVTAHDFFEDAETLKIDPVKFKATFSDWEMTGDYFWESIACDLIVGTIAIMLNVVAKKLKAWKLEEDAEREETQRKINEAKKQGLWDPYWGFIEKLDA